MWLPGGRGNGEFEGPVGTGWLEPWEWMAVQDTAGTAREDGGGDRDGDQEGQTGVGACSGEPWCPWCSREQTLHRPVHAAGMLTCGHSRGASCPTCSRSPAAR